MRPAESELGSLTALLEASETLFAARVTPDGTIVSANAALERWAGAALARTRLPDLLTSPQRPALGRALQEAGPEWRSITVGFDDGSPRPAEDRRVHLLRDGDEVVVVAEPAVAERDRL